MNEVNTVSTQALDGAQDWLYNFAELLGKGGQAEKWKVVVKETRSHFLCVSFYLTLVLTITSFNLYLPHPAKHFFFFFHPEVLYWLYSQ